MLFRSAVYFVVSHGDEPEQLFFSAEEAFAYGAMYVDGFDEDGLKVASFKLQNEDATITCEDDYTSIF